MMSAQSTQTHTVLEPKTVLLKHRGPHKFIKKRRLAPLVTYSMGPQTAFEHNRVRRALVKYHTGGEPALAAPSLPAPEEATPHRVAPPDSEDTTSEPAFRSLGGESSQASPRASPYPPKYAIQTVKLSPKAVDHQDMVLAASNDMANAELEKVVARDTTRDEIDRNLKGLHAQKLCTRREMAGSVIIFLLQRMVPKEAIDVLTASTYKLFDVKNLYYGDFVNRSVRVKVGGEFVKATTTAYHSFDGFRAVYTNSDGKETEIAIKHATPWEWA